MASYITLYPENLSSKTEVWTLSIAEAKRAIAQLDTTKGTYWDQLLVHPTRRAVRNHAETVTVYTAGFSSSQLANALA